MTTLFALLAAPVSSDPIRFMIGFILLCCVIAVVIILAKWLISLPGVTIPPPLLLVLGIVLFVVLMLWLLGWSGIYHW